MGTAENRNRIDDSTFATDFISERIRRGWARRKIEIELKRKGDDANDLPCYPVDIFSDDDELDRAIELLSRKSIPSVRPQEKLIRQRKGDDANDLPCYPVDIFSDDDELDRAIELLSRKSIPSVRPQEKLIRHLMAKGFSYSVSAEAARRRLSSDTL